MTFGQCVAPYGGALAARGLSGPAFPVAAVEAAALVFLQECVALLVIVLGETRLLKRLLPLADPVSQHSANALPPTGAHWPQGGRTPEPEALERRVRQDSRFSQCVAPYGGALAIGLGRLLNQPEFAAGERARQLVQSVEDGALPERAVSAARQPAPQVYIGSENREESLRGFGMIVCRYGRPDGVGGAICVVGPTRMGYATAIAGTRHLAAAMGRMAGTLEDGDGAD